MVGNVGDDVEILGLHVSPDLDSLLYTLGGLIDDERGWGRAGETWNALESAVSWGGEDWFRLASGTSGFTSSGRGLSGKVWRCPRQPCGSASEWSLISRIIPATDDRLRTHVVTPAGTFPFQEWFVARGHRDDVDGVEYEDAGGAGPRRGYSRL